MPKPGEWQDGISPEEWGNGRDLPEANPVSHKNMEVEVKPEVRKILVESYRVFNEALNPRLDVVYYPASENDVSPSEAFPGSRVIYVEDGKIIIEEKRDREILQTPRKLEEYKYHHLKEYKEIT